jgi:ubiquinol-cytochrome c reductase cytochrome b subunit
VRAMRRALRWIVERFGLEPVVEFVREHRVPAALGTRTGWMYVFGFATLTAFLVQIATGLALSTSYVASPATAHDTLVHLTEETAWGGLVRGMHYFGASAMVLLLLAHMARVYLTASYKFPRQANWMTGVLLAIGTFSMALTGQLLRWDQNGLWTTVVIAKFVSRVPLVGAGLAEFVLAGPEVNAATLPRFASLHMIVLPALLVTLVALHVYMLLRSGVSEPPNVEVPLEPAAYLRWYEDHEEHEGVKYFPDAAWRELVVAFAVVAGIVALAALVGPRGPGPAPDPTEVAAQPAPDWFVRFYYALITLKPAGLETLLMVYAPLAVMLLLFLLPVFAGHGRRTFRHRPWAPAVVLFAAVALGWLTVIGVRSPWTTEFDAPPIGPELLGVSGGPVLEGAQLFRERGCQLCHRALGSGGEWGPDLTGVALRLPPEEIAIRIVQGYRGMPPYRDTLEAGELELLIAFLRALPARAEASGR